MQAKLPTQEKGMCRRLRRRQISWKELLLRVKIVDDPKRMTELNAELQRRRLGLLTMDDPRRTMENKQEKWMELCELATREEDPNKLMALTAEIVRLLDEKKNRSGLLDAQDS